MPMLKSDHTDLRNDAQNFSSALETEAERRLDDGEDGLAGPLLALARRVRNVMNAWSLAVLDAHEGFGGATETVEEKPAKAPKHRHVFDHFDGVDNLCSVQVPGKGPGDDTVLCGKRKAANGRKPAAALAVEGK